MALTRRVRARGASLMTASLLVLSACTTDTPHPAPPGSVGPSKSTASTAGSAPATGQQPEPSTATPVRLEIASANVRAGSRFQRPLDIRGGDDRDAFARRLFVPDHGGPPDILLLQESIGTTRSTVRTLNRHARTRGLPDRYVVALGPDLQSGARQCDGRRAPHYRMRDTSIIVNARTVGPVLDSGSIRTWGRWAQRPGLDSNGCSEQGWVHARLRGEAADGVAEVFVVNVHLAPAGLRLKSHALDVTMRHALHRHATTAPDAFLVLAGDFNMTRCPPAGEPERLDCRARPAHRRLKSARFTDAIRDQHPRGRYGVAGVQKRIDFIYTQDRVVRSLWDRCYLAYFVTVDPCGRRAVFRSKLELVECQRRADNAGVPGGQCPARQYRRYYSDHPILRARLAN